MDHGLEFNWVDFAGAGHEVNAIVFHAKVSRAIVLYRRVVVQPNDIVVRWWQSLVKALLKVAGHFAGGQCTCYPKKQSSYENKERKLLSSRSLVSPSKTVMFELSTAYFRHSLLTSASPQTGYSEVIVVSVQRQSL